MFDIIKNRVYKRRIIRRQTLRKEVDNMITTLESVKRDIEIYGITAKRAKFIEDLGIRLSTIAHMCK